MDIESLFSSLHSLPTIPKVAQDLIKQFDNPSSTLDQVAQNITLDPVIAAKVLRLANSARFRGARESTSVQDAAMRLGFDTLRTLVLASAVTGAFKAPGGYDLKAFWGHAFKVASVAREVGTQHGVASDTSFTCGMLHNIGELLIVIGAPDQVQRLGGTRQGSSARAARETLQLGFGFPEVGAELAKRWHLPLAIQQAIAYQGRPNQAPEPGQELAQMLAQATFIVDVLDETDNDMAAARTASDSPLLDDLDLERLFQRLPVVLEADKVFAQSLL